MSDSAPRTSPRLCGFALASFLLAFIPSLLGSFLLLAALLVEASHSR